MRKRVLIVDISDLNEITPAQGVKNCCASAVNNLAGLEEIIRASDLSNCNKEGECFVHVASGMGQLDVLKFLHFKGADLFRLDEVCICS
ncbi:hypothetical protein AVEN_90747-1 [Araneus ventricosus]|uniref:Uncharacterized protein n=1 Tax=Araneus ventricosus TaxID=182803 RepID=A0A4Y2TRN7_ARAVE|nr:hypothetical protein AVEN_90747-1 [Araneus ventricosus]